MVSMSDPETAMKISEMATGIAAAERPVFWSPLILIVTRELPDFTPLLLPPPPLQLRDMAARKAERIRAIVLLNQVFFIVVL
jgi:hypothetical protein